MNDGYAPPTKRSVLIAGHQTSISLEPIFWKALEKAARARGLPINALVAEIDAERLNAKPTPNLTSALRQWLFAQSRGSLDRLGETLPGTGRVAEE